MPASRKFYVVWKGRRPGIYTTWDEAKRQVDGYGGARYKSFPSREAAEAAFGGPAPVWRDGAGSDPEPRKPSAELLARLGDFYIADAACSGNPGRLEYRCLHVPTGRYLFERAYPRGTNNIGEFLAVAETLMLLAERSITAPVYSDSKIALNWIKAGRCKTQLPAGARERALFEAIDRAEAWLAAHRCPNRVLRWDTDEWGENPADYGRK